MAHSLQIYRVEEDFRHEYNVRCHRHTGFASQRRGFDSLHRGCGGQSLYQGKPPGWQSVDCVCLLSFYRPM
jgi:hypothetical protein